MKKKFVMTGSSEVFVERSCRWEHSGTKKDSCLHEQISGGIEVKFCETCDSDACNESSKLKAMMVLVFSLVVANFSK